MYFQRVNRRLIKQELQQKTKGAKCIVTSKKQLFLLWG
jgi:hypothetical protein